MSEEQRQPTSAARPTGKRQLAGTSTVDASQAEAKKVAKREHDDRPGGSVVQFLPEVGKEMRKVIWPTTKQMVNYTIIVFAFLILMTALVAGVDFIAGLGVEKVLSQ
ncbi:preprotein translocase subunit SecE [Corynebacterium pseudopelargi]|uniref:Protein translocase subunit SecE n=1 Tax=Corynebacterium pseudopelargi TaxID=2080757 RepID=A0A3G6IZH9_9CORY|nr:preprotein translocase subunit SecE [Corynebacterium pseudopelargi]AZA10088.1 preprotein translocase subunit SecE [Corynebacterium pseudopelargi]